MSMTTLAANAAGNKAGGAAGNAVLAANEESELEISAASIMKVKADTNTKLRDLRQDTIKNEITVDIKGASPINF